MGFEIFIRLLLLSYNSVYLYHRPSKFLCPLIYFIGFFGKVYSLTLVLLNPDISRFANSVDPDQLASEEAN